MTRVRLTEDEAGRGVQPPLYSRAEWDAMNRAVEEYTHRLFRLRFWSSFDLAPDEAQ